MAKKSKSKKRPVAKAKKTAAKKGAAKKAKRPVKAKAKSKVKVKAKKKTVAKKAVAKKPVAKKAVKAAPKKAAAKKPKPAVIAPAPVEVTFAAQDDYVYYPSYGVYYSSNRHQYAYVDGGAWVLRPQPRGVSVNVLLASPSVRMDFHDSPALHHAAIARQYPKSWKPSGGNDGRKDDGHGGR